MFRPITASTVCFEAQKILDNIWQNKSQIPKVKSHKDFKLIISCQNSCDMQELSMLKELIVTEMKNINLDSMVKEIRFTLDS